MRFALLLAVLVSASSGWAQTPSAGEKPEAPLPEVRKLEGAVPEGAVVVVPLKGEVSKAQFFFLRRILKAGEAANVEKAALV